MNTSIGNHTCSPSFNCSDESAREPVYSLFAASHLVNLILGLPINGFVLWLIVTGAGGTLASEFFTLNLTVSEILYCLSAVFVLLQVCGVKTIVFDLSIKLSTGLVATGRPLFQCCICVERYLAVVHPVVFLKYKPLRYRVGCCVVVWLMVLGSCLANLFDSNRTIPVFYMGQDLVVFSVMLFGCLSILWALKKPGPGDGEREGTNNMKLRAFRIILIIMVSLLPTYLPLFVTVSLKHYLSSEAFLSALLMSFCLLLVVGFVQPLLYLHRAGKLPCIGSL